MESFRHTGAYGSTFLLYEGLSKIFRWAHLEIHIYGPIPVVPVVGVDLQILREL